MSASGERGGGDLTLAFSLSAIERLAEPAAAFADAREWSRSVGIVDDDTDAIREFVERHGLTQDYDLRGRDRWLVLEELQEAVDSPRHVYVGVDLDDRRVADHLRWEYVPVTEAARKAGWTLADESQDGTIVGALRRMLPFGSGP